MTVRRSTSEPMTHTIAPMLVAIRCRGLNTREQQLGELRFPNRKDTNYCSVVGCDANKGRIRLIDPDSVGNFYVDLRGQTDGDKQDADREYRFDLVFDPTSTNEEVYAATVAPLVQCVKEGFNGTCFAYGMTGAGKTYTMLGTASEVAARKASSGKSSSPQKPQQVVPGLCSLAVDDLFPSQSNDGVVTTVHVSYLELYNERVRDLLVPPSKKTTTQPFCASSASARAKTPVECSGPSLDIVDDAEKGVHVPGLTEVLVTNTQQLELLIDQGGAQRTKATTASNAVSSRSHAILQLTVRRRIRGGKEDGQDRVLTGRLTLIDLAGSERATSEGEGKAEQRRREGANINRSLLALGNCITVLGSISRREEQYASGAKSLPHIPYRDSKLTRLLKESLGGNTRTVMIASITPSCLCFEETLSTLKYASRAKTITRHVQRNAVTVEERHQEEEDYRNMVVALQSEVQSLRTQLYITQQTNIRLGLVEPPPNEKSVRPSVKKPIAVGTAVDENNSPIRRQLTSNPTTPSSPPPSSTTTAPPTKPAWTPQRAKHLEFISSIQQQLDAMVAADASIFSPKTQ